MNREKVVDDLNESDLTDLIADELPSEARAEYFRELNHCKSLPKDDEMLRILRILQILTLLMVQVPGKVAIERQKLEQLFAALLKKIQESHQASQAWQKQIDERLANLPAKITAGVNPAAIVDGINESLKQEFLLSTIPQTGESLRLVSKQMKSASDEFMTTAKDLTHSYRGVTDNANQAIDRMRASISGAAEAATEATKNFSRTFHLHYRGALYTLSVLALLVGIGIGMLLQPWLSPPPDTNEYIHRMDLLTPVPAPIPKRK
jgi:hypothetical protein